MAEKELDEGPPGGSIHSVYGVTGSMADAELPITDSSDEESEPPVKLVADYGQQNSDSVYQGRDAVSAAASLQNEGDCTSVIQILSLPPPPPPPLTNAAVLVEQPTGPNKDAENHHATVPLEPQDGTDTDELPPEEIAAHADELVNSGALVAETPANGEKQDSPGEGDIGSDRKAEEDTENGLLALTAETPATAETQDSPGEEDGVSDREAEQDTENASRPSNLLRLLNEGGDVVVDLVNVRVTPSRSDRNKRKRTQPKVLTPEPPKKFMSTRLADLDTNKQRLLQKITMESVDPVTGSAVAMNNALFFFGEKPAEVGAAAVFCRYGRWFLTTIKKVSDDKSRFWPEFAEPKGGQRKVTTGYPPEKVGPKYESNGPVRCLPMEHPHYHMVTSAKGIQKGHRITTVDGVVSFVHNNNEFRHVLLVSKNDGGNKWEVPYMKLIKWETPKKPFPLGTKTHQLPKAGVEMTYEVRVSVGADETSSNGTALRATRRRLPLNRFNVTDDTSRQGDAGYESPPGPSHSRSNTPTATPRTAFVVQTTPRSRSSNRRRTLSQRQLAGVDDVIQTVIEQNMTRDTASTAYDEHRIRRVVERCLKPVRDEMKGLHDKYKKLSSEMAKLNLGGGGKDWDNGLEQQEEQEMDDLGHWNQQQNNQAPWNVLDGSYASPQHFLDDAGGALAEPASRNDNDFCFGDALQHMHSLTLDQVDDVFARLDEYCVPAPQPLYESSVEGRQLHLEVQDGGTVQQQHSALAERRQLANEYDETRFHRELTGGENNTASGNEFSSSFIEHFPQPDLIINIDDNVTDEDEFEDDFHNAETAVIGGSDVGDALMSDVSSNADCDAPEEYNDDWDAPEEYNSDSDGMTDFSGYSSAPDSDQDDRDDDTSGGGSMVPAQQLQQHHSPQRSRSTEDITALLHITPKKSCLNPMSLSPYPRSSRPRSASPIRVRHVGLSFERKEKVYDTDAASAEVYCAKEVTVDTLPVPVAKARLHGVPPMGSSASGGNTKKPTKRSHKQPTVSAVKNPRRSPGRSRPSQRDSDASYVEEAMQDLEESGSPVRDTMVNITTLQRTSNNGGQKFDADLIEATITHRPEVVTRIHSGQGALLKVAPGTAVLWYRPGCDIAPSPQVSMAALHAMQRLGSNGGRQMFLAYVDAYVKMALKELPFRVVIIGGALAVGACDGATSVSQIPSELEEPMRGAIKGAIEYLGLGIQQPADVKKWTRDAYGAIMNTNRQKVRRARLLSSKMSWD